MRHRAARTVSILLNPAAALVLGGALFIRLSPVSMAAGLKWVAISAAVTILPVYLAIRLAERQGETNFSNREHRPLFYLLALILGLTLLGVMEFY